MKGVRRWGRWEAREPSFAEGGQGYVYRVVDRNGELPGTFVLKQLKSDKRQARFEREIHAIASLAPHPNVVPLVDSGIFSDKGKPCYVMPEADGGSLESFLKTQPHDVERLLGLFAQVVEGVAHIHAAGIIHRDIKPENILMFQGTPKVSDLGLALVAEAPRLTPDYEAVGPRFYMAPERDGRCLDVTTRADLYSLGKVLYFMLSGGRIFSREKQNRDDWDLARLHNDDRYELFTAILRRTIAQSSRERYASATELVSAVMSRSGDAARARDHPRLGTGTLNRVKTP